MADRSRLHDIDIQLSQVLTVVSLLSIIFRVTTLQWKEVETFNLILIETWMKICVNTSVICEFCRKKLMFYYKENIVWKHQKQTFLSQW